MGEFDGEHTVWYTWGPPPGGGFEIAAHKWKRLGTWTNEPEAREFAVAAAEHFNVPLDVRDSAGLGAA